MAGGAMPEQGGGGKRRKKALDAVINVVPAIDLLSCCITFLLYTAVWTQISRLQVQQFGSGAPEPPAGEEQKALLVTLQVGERGMTLTTTAGLQADIPIAQDGTELHQDLKTLGDKLKQLRADYPEATSVTISSEDNIPYGDLVQVIDVCVGQGLVSVSVTGV
jgi:biopolymer transport protein TolR